MFRIDNYFCSSLWNIYATNDDNDADIAGSADTDDDVDEENEKDVNEDVENGEDEDKNYFLCCFSCMIAMCFFFLSSK